MVGPVAAALRKLHALARCEDGVSAVEFALIAPVFAAALVAMVDVGLALYERMSMDHILRSGGQAAMSDPGPSQVLKVMQSAIASGFVEGPETIKLDLPKRFCACPDNTEVDPAQAPACSDPCPDSTVPYVYYRIRASKTYDGVFVPPIPLDSSLQVQVR
jgi:pilus assembly protein CpaE